MATTDFTNGVTLTDAAWFNDVDELDIDQIGTSGTPAANLAAVKDRVSRLVQRVEATPYTTYTSDATALPPDDSIPQSGEGLEVLTASITPKSASNRLIIEARVIMSADASRTLIAALFQDSTADALAVGMETSPAAGNMMTVFVRHEMAAGTTSATTFKIRAGTTTGTFYINGTDSARAFGGIASCRLSIMEYQA